MSPEQVRASADLDARTDIWSLGCVLYELLTLRVPFHRNSRMESCAAVLEQEPPPLRALRPDLPAELEVVIARCLRKLASERYANVAELAEALAPFAPERARRHTSRCRQLLSAGPRMTIATDPGRRSRPSGPSFGSTRASSPEALVATQLMDPLGMPDELALQAPVAIPRKRSRRGLLIGAALVASAAGFVVMQHMQQGAWLAPIAATRPDTSLAKGAQVRSLAPQLPPGPVAGATPVAEPAALPVVPQATEALAEPTPQAERASSRGHAGRTQRPLARRPARQGASAASDGPQQPSALRDEPDVGF